MPIDLSVVGPGSASAKDAIQRKKRRLAENQARPITGPGSMGLGIGPEQGVVMHRGTGGYRTQVAPRSGIYQRLASIPPDQRTWVERKMQNVDTMLRNDRFAPAQAFYQSRGAAFGLTIEEAKKMIKAGILSYGKGGNM